MYDLIIRQALRTDGSLTDIAIQDGKFAAIGTLAADATARQTLNLQGKVYASAGWIDSHVHCYPKSPIYHCLLYTSPSPRDRTRSRMPSSA